MPIRPELWKATFPMLGKFIDRVGASGHYDEYHSIFPPAWHFGNCALMGDAAHGMTPALGQGANSAMMTAYALGASDFSLGPMSNVLTRWETQLRPSDRLHAEVCRRHHRRPARPQQRYLLQRSGFAAAVDADIPGTQPGHPGFSLSLPTTDAGRI